MTDENSAGSTAHGVQRGKVVSLTCLDELARVYASNYASPHHFTLGVEGLRNLIDALGVQSSQALSDEQVIDFAVRAGLHDEMWFGPHTPKGYEDTLPKLRRFAELARTAGVPERVMSRDSKRNEGGQ